MSIKFINRVASWEQLNEIAQQLETERTTDRTLPREDWEKKSHSVVIDLLGEHGRYQFTLYFDKWNERLERVSVLVVK